MNHGSLFSGFGGFDLAASWMGWNNVFHCEWNPFGQKILKYYWPEAISYDDICKTDFTIHRGNIDILTGGFPCQPYSVAGKRKGTEDSRHLWPEMRRAIRECRPTWIVGENVPGIINWSKGLVFEQVCADLESEGYEVQPVVLPACGIDAPHKRERIWFVAYAACHDDRGTEREIYKENGGQIGELLSAFSSASGGINNARFAFNPNNERCKERNAPGVTDKPHIGSGRPVTNWSHWPTVAPICSRDDGLSYGLDGITFSKWRNESIKGYGNAIVPQVAYQIFKVIEEMENQNNEYTL